jgi:putative DNA primase/helicase
MDNVINFDADVKTLAHACDNEILANAADTDFFSDEHTVESIFGDVKPAPNFKRSALKAASQIESVKNEQPKKAKKADTQVAKVETEDKLSEHEQIAAFIDVADTKKREPTVEFAYVSRTYQDGTLVTGNYRRKNGNIYYWTGEYWQQQDTDDLKSQITAWLKLAFPTHLEIKKVNSIFGIFTHSLRELSNETIEDIIIPTRKHWLTIDLKSGDITAIKPNKDVPLTYQIDVEVAKPGRYTILAFNKTGLFQGFITSSLKNTETRALVQEYCGLTLTPTQRKQKCQLWIGDGANGKSQLVEALAGIHSRPVSTVAKEIGKYNDHFIPASLIYATEIDKGGFDQEFLKAAVAGDTLEVRGIYGKKQSTKLTAKWILIGNNFPRITDFSQGLFRRVDIIRWTESFQDSPKKVEDLSTLILKTEKNVLLNWCLQGLQRLIKNDWKFTKSAESEKAHSEFVFQSDKVRLFTSELDVQYDEGRTTFMDKDVMFDSFNKWADRNNFEQMSSTGFWTRMKSVFPQMQKDSPDMKKNGKRVVHLLFKVQ